MGIDLRMKAVMFLPEIARTLRNLDLPGMAQGVEEAHAIIQAMPSTDTDDACDAARWRLWASEWNAATRARTEKLMDQRIGKAAKVRS